MSKVGTKQAKKIVVVPVNSSIVSAYQAITADSKNLNQEGLDFIVLVGKLIASKAITADCFKASIKQAGINPLVAIKESHAEILATALFIINGTTGEITVAKVLSLATRVKRSKVDFKIGETFEELEARTPSIKEIAESKKDAKVEDTATVKVPALDALVIQFALDLAKATKGDLLGMELGDISTKSLEVMSGILRQLNQNKKAHAKK